MSMSVEAPVCTKVPYPNRWTAQAALVFLQRKGWPVKSIHPCYAGHPGAWHVTRQRQRG